MAIDRKYGEVRLEHGDIHEDEPVFVLRAQDRLAVPLLWMYRELCEVVGAPQAHLTGIDIAVTGFHAWQTGHVTKTPGQR